MEKTGTKKTKEKQQTERSPEESRIFQEHKKGIAEFITDKEYKPLKFREMAALLQVPKEEKEELRQVLKELMEEGVIIQDAQSRYKGVSADTLIGIFSGTQRGFGFVHIEGEPEDIFIPEVAVNGALHGDRVQVECSEPTASLRPTGKARREGRVVRIVERNTLEIVGTYQKEKHYGFVIPDNRKLGTDIFVPKGADKGAVSGHKVVVKLTSYGNGQNSPEGEIVEILGHINDPGVDILSIVRAYGLPEEFPQDVMRQAGKAPEEVDSKELAGRMDLRDWETVTIDGEDAKDLDDAITLTKEGDGYLLGVHIADVTHYVKEGDALDQEALKRGTSVYLVDRVIPMLPHRLSNGICSLNEGTDRLALSCLMEIDEKGAVVGHRIAETVIRVNRRMSYTAVQRILDGEEETIEEYQELVPLFLRMAELAELLRKKRRKRGSIDFDFPESKIVLDQKGRPLEIKAYERNTATRIIEDFMLAANETVAEDYFWQELPFVYRSHENPDAERIQKLGTFIYNFGYRIRVGQEEIHPKEIQKLMEQIEGKPEEALISRITLRSLKRASYTVESLGHFGLAARYYCHFTSPIRRYPDLQIHRIIKENLRGSLTEKRIRHYEARLPEVADRSSRRERLADEAEREVEKMKKAEYMSHHIGETFEGVISGVTAAGLYVELPNTIEGMVKVSNLWDDYYSYIEERYELVGEDTGRTFKLGEHVQVKVIDSDKQLKTVDFMLLESYDCPSEEDDAGQ